MRDWIMDDESLQRIAHKLRRTVLEMAWTAGSGHIGGSFSCAEILTVLYRAVMRVDPDDPRMPDRDIFILSKGHAAPALYFALAERGFFEPGLLNSLRRKDSMLQGHPDMHRVPGIEISTGSLGMGISNAIGFCLAARLNRITRRAYVLCGDGELDEGQCWEAFMAAAKYRLADLIVVIDRNHVQLDGTTEDIMPLGDLKRKIDSFGWQTFTCNGHCISDLRHVFGLAGQRSGRPQAIIAETVKGKGVSFMEGKSVWHGKPLTQQEYSAAATELERL